MQRILIDTNILMLLIIGSWNPQAIAGFKRTATFTIADFNLLQDRLRRYSHVVTTPSVVTEASNLMGNGHETVAGALIEVCTPFVEVTPPKNDVLASESFPRLGFGDASILAALDENTLLLTDDLGLYNQALYLGLEAVNFNHLRKF